ncbi:hypothetical protein GALLR39Z86_39720 [Glycomyces algeriensis]|uniref:Uncharacterized protein n=1 Tax=Glycomyces algeriensis TaxID=256037 RepID=A0A9W6GC48_9ACTN|nr:hypothetical protein GALLR39Z86_39720 [Glycomyces algeriensis]
MVTDKPGADRRQASGIGWAVLADPEGNEFCPRWPFTPAHRLMSQLDWDRFTGSAHLRSSPSGTVRTGVPPGQKDTAPPREGGRDAHPWIELIHHRFKRTDLIILTSDGIRTRILAHHQEDMQ